MEETFNITTDKDTKEIVIRKGEALPLREKNKVQISGSISAPRLFFEKRNADHESKWCHVLYSKNEQKIKLVVDEEDKLGKDVTGVLEMNTDFKDFGINSMKMYTVQELMQFLKLRKFFFDDRDQNVTIVTNLQKFKASITTQIEQEKSNQGNQKKVLDIKVDSNIPLNFVLSMPIFKGFDNYKFAVEICYDVRDNSAILWLESVELAELMASETARIITEELKSFEAIVCIEY